VTNINQIKKSRALNQHSRAVLVEKFASNPSPTNKEIAKSLKSPEGRRFFMLGYRILLGYERAPERDLTEGQKAYGYYNEIVYGEGVFSKLKVARAARAAIHFSSRMRPPATKERHELISHYINDVAVEALRPVADHSDPAVEGLPLPSLQVEISQPLVGKELKPAA
jgi:hypothetical protein